MTARRFFKAVGISLAVLALGVVVLFVATRWSMRTNHGPVDWTRHRTKVLQVGSDNYLAEHKRLPVESLVGDDLSLVTDGSNRLIDALLAQNLEANPRQILFAEFPVAKNGTAGLVDQGGTLSLIDPWGHPFTVLLDTDGDNKIDPNPDLVNTDPAIGRDAPLHLRTRVAVWSRGPDGLPHTADDIVSWR